MTAPRTPKDEVFTKVRDFVTRYVNLPKPEQADVLALWIIHTWTFSESVPTPYTTPYIYIHSPEKQSGKTRTIEVLSTLVRNPVQTANSTVSAMFRMIEMMQPTIMLDEADTIWSGAKNEELRGMVNSGYKRGGHIWRTEALEPTKFSTFGPKLFAGIDNGLLPDTISDRCIPITLQRSKEPVPDFFDWEVTDEVEELVESIVRWVVHHSEVTRARPVRLDGISDRAWEISFPLVAIAEAMGMGKRARNSLKLLLTREEKQSPQAELLSTIRDAFDESGQDRLFTNTIIEKLGDHWNGKLLGNKLRPYGISAGSIRIGNENAKGFYRSDFEDAWERYL